jgi:hypothetical protein
MEIRADSSGSPASTVVTNGTSTNSFTSTQIVANATSLASAIASKLTFTFSGVSLTAGTSYWVVLHASVANTSGSGSPVWGNKGTGTNIPNRSGDGVTWTPLTAATQNWFKTYH